jgi:two-component system response regulator AtoC
MNKQKVLVIDDDKYSIESYREIFSDENVTVDYFMYGLEAYKHFKSHSSDYVIAFIDHNLQKDSGIYSDGSELAKQLREINEDLVIVIVSADSSDEAYRKWIQVDSAKILYKPFSKEKIIANVNSAIDKHRQDIAPYILKGAVKNYLALTGMIGISNEYQDTAKDILRFADHDSSDVLILAETGMGKELAAKAIHNNSKRSKTGPFIAINCSSFKGDSDLMESELFGHERGAFTGAINQKLGVFEAAHRGTLFLDEIHHLGKAAQAKLLRVLQEKKIKRVGSTKEFAVDVRVICAAKPKLWNMCQGDDPEFLPDLYFRITPLVLTIAPLRERTEDIVPLTKHFSKMMSEKCGTDKEFSPNAVRALKSYNWPGNIRELENTVERLFVMVDGSVIRKKNLPDEILQAISIKDAIADLDLETLEKLQQEQLKKLILMTLKKHNHNIKQAALSLNVKRTTLNSRMKSLGIFDSSPEERNGMLKNIIKNLSNLKILYQEEYV